MPAGKDPAGGSAAALPGAMFVPSNGIDMFVRQAGEGPVVALLHGFPELGYSWRYLMRALARTGWRAIAPDLRGYGATGVHGGIAAYSLKNLAQDVIGLLDALGVPNAVVAGHDFGGALAWTLARDHPSRFRGAISLNTPYTRRGTEDLASSMRRHRGEQNYMVRFQEPGVGERLLGRDVPATFRALMRRTALSLAQFKQAEPSLRALPATLFTGEPAVMGAPIMSDEELQVYIDAFRATGFEGALNWYRNLHRNWLDTAAVADRVEVPALMISAADDYFLPPETTDGMERYVPDLERHVLPDCGHWTMYERPAEATAIILEWLERRMNPARTHIAAPASARPADRR